MGSRHATGDLEKPLKSEVATAEFLFRKAEIVTDFVNDRFHYLPLHIVRIAEGFLEAVFVKLDAGWFHLNTKHGTPVVRHTYKYTEHQMAFVLILEHTRHCIPGQYLDALSLQYFPEFFRDFVQGFCNGVFEFTQFHDEMPGLKTDLISWKL